MRQNKSKLRDRVSLLARIAVSAAVLTIVVSKLGISDSSLPFFERLTGNVLAIFKKLGSIPQGIILLGMVLFSFSFLCVTVRWWIFLKDRGFKIKYASVVKYSLIGYLFNNIMPSTLGGDIIKGYYLHRDTKSAKKSAVFTIFIDRLTGAAATFIFLLVGCLYLRNTIPLMKFVAVALLFFLVAFIAAAIVLDEKFLIKLSLYRKLPEEHPIKKLHSALFYYKRKGLPAFFAALFLSLFVQIAIISVNYAIITTLTGKSIPYATFVCFVPLINVIQGLPVSFAGWGIGEAAYSVFFSMVSITPEVSVTASLFYKLIMLLFGFIGLPFYVLNKPSEITRSEERA